MAAIAEGRVLVDGAVTSNPDSWVRKDARLTIQERPELRGWRKLSPVLASFGVVLTDRAALDVGAAAGGFTRALLDAGARRVYAVDVGYGQLLGSLRQDPRVVTIERTNLAELDRRRIPEPIDVVTMDLSYLSIASATPHLDRIELGPRPDLVALVKPMFELGRGEAPDDEDSLREAAARARAGLQAAGWQVLAEIPSPSPGARGARELFVHATRRR